MLISVFIIQILLGSDEN